MNPFIMGEVLMKFKRSTTEYFKKIKTKNRNLETIFKFYRLDLT